MKTTKLALAAAAAVLTLSGLAQGANIVVDTIGDGNSGCTLRRAIQNANDAAATNAGCAAGSSSGNTIMLGTITYALSLSAKGPLNLINRNITIQGNGPANTIIDGQGQDWIFDNFGSLAETGITITITGLTVKNGHAIGTSGFDPAGAMFIESNATAILDNVAFTNNSVTASGGAISNMGNLTINNSTFSGNSAPNGEGGAIRNTGVLTITNSTFSGNSAIRGGAIYHVGDNAGEALGITNSTFSGNTATGLGGAIAANNGSAALGPITLTHVTVANNSAGTGGGIYRNQAGAFSIERSIIANNTATTGPDCNSTSAFVSLNYNVLGSTTGCTLTGTIANNYVGAVTLGALANNGGPTQTISLPAGSPARDRAPTPCSPTTTDQRGTARPQGLSCDSGAFEASPLVPDAPTIGTATAGNATASITFTANGNGGATIASFTMTSTPGGITGTGTTSPIVVSGLANGTSYTFKVTATNSAGTSAASSSSNSVTPIGPPGAPTITGVTAGNGQVSIAFSPPGSDGGATVFTYTATSSPGGFTASGSSSPLVVDGLANGTAYTFTVRATNSQGQGPASAASVSVTPATLPGAPTIGTATGGNAQASITFTAPLSNGGSAITSYIATSSPGGFTGSGATSPVVVSGLANGTAYTFTVTATNGVGTGPASAASNSVTPATVPDAPAIGTATAGNTQASVTFTPPGSNGGSAITGYTATSSPGGITGSGASSPIVVNGLANGTAYTFTVTANNAKGASVPSAPSNSVVPHPAIAIHNDFNADGKPDLLWSNTSNGGTYAWYMNGPLLISDAFITQVDPVWKIQGIADFNGDGEPDLVWRNSDTGAVLVWYMDGATLLGDAQLFTLAPEWVIQGVADFNGDGKPDFLLRNTTTGIGFAWYFNNVTPIGDQYLFQIDPSWKVEAVGDLNGDIQPDLIFRSMTSGLAFTWFTQYSAGTLSLAGSSAAMFNIDPVWEIVQLDDWNGDANRDLVFRNRDTGVVLVWYMTGTTLAGSDVITQVDAPWEIVPRR